MHLDTQVKGPVSGARVRRNAAFGRAILMALGTGLVWLLLAGCHRSPMSIPESPPEAATMVMQRLVDNQPRVLWDALPPSYRSDIRGLIVTFCDLEELEHARHGGKPHRRAGSSNYAFVDGSTRSLRFGLSITPVNMWATTDKWRHAPPLPLDRIP
jgi:hypothetical protein